MPRAIISIAEFAVCDLEEVQAWYVEQGVKNGGTRLVAEILQRVAALAEHPDRGWVVPEFDQPFLRELIHPPFRSVYRRVSVVRVWRSERLIRLPSAVAEEL